MIAIAAGVSDPGCKRPQNEDRIFLNKDRSVFVLADGMGGERCGELAAEIAVSVVADYLSGSHESSAADDDDSLQPAQNRLRHAVRLANLKVWEASQAQPDCAGMGCTISAVLLEDQSAVIGNIGDSRVYLYRGAQLQRLTRDDAVVSTLVDAGTITLEDARRHPLRNVLTLALGRSRDIKVQLVQSKVVAGDQLLLSTDGLHGVVSDEEIREIMETERDPATRSQALLDAAKRRGGPDNISCIVIACQ